MAETVDWPERRRHPWAERRVVVLATLATMALIGGGVGLSHACNRGGDSAHTTGDATTPVTGLTGPVALPASPLGSDPLAQVGVPVGNGSGEGTAPEVRRLERGDAGDEEGSGEASAPTEWSFDVESLSLDLSALERIGDDAHPQLVQRLETGETVVLTLDPDLQAHLSEIVAQYDEPAQAVVALDPITGRVLAWVEDTNELTPTAHPLSSADVYAASIFKIVTASALIETAQVDRTLQLCVPEAASGIDEADLTPDSARDSRCGDLSDALAHSTNVYFARMADSHLTGEQMTSWLERFGFNMEIPFELPVAASLAEVPEDRLERARMAAGFRHAYLSPLHGALLAAAVANQGRMMRPTLVAQVLDASGTVVYEHEPQVWRDVMSPATAELMASELAETTTTGTARRYFSGREGWPTSLTVAGKTGTLSNRSADDPEPDPLLTYTWFVGFATIEEPRIAVAGLVYNTERWHIKGSYLASEAILQYLQD